MMDRERKLWSPVTHREMRHANDAQRTNVPNSRALRYVNLKKELTTAGELPSFTLN
jgi:hypothetical protein